MTSEARAEIVGVLEAFTKGLRDHDAESVTALYASDAKIYSLAPPLVEPPDEAELALWLASWDGPVKQELHDFRIESSGDVAFAFGLIRVSARTNGGEHAEWWMRATRCFLKTDDGWKIVNEHDSVPFYMDGSDRAALDLTP